MNVTIQTQYSHLQLLTPKNVFHDHADAMLWGIGPTSVYCSIIPTWVRGFASSKSRRLATQCTACGNLHDVLHMAERDGLAYQVGCECMMGLSWYYVCTHQEWHAVRRYVNDSNPWKKQDLVNTDAITFYSTPEAKQNIINEQLGGWTLVGWQR